MTQLAAGAPAIEIAGICAALPQNVMAALRNLCSSKKAHLTVSQRAARRI
jgi:hypothetical protein